MNDQLEEWIENEKIENLLLQHLRKTMEQIENAKAQLKIYEDTRDMLCYWARSEGINVTLETLSKKTGMSETSVVRAVKHGEEFAGKRPSLDTLKSVI